MSISQRIEETADGKQLTVNSGCTIDVRDGATIRVASGAAIDGLITIVRLTQAEYDALELPDSKKLYVIVG